ncbi:MAG: serine/threonine protein kinase [Scytonematopsis contorta HA4267-MV1]|jgi:serine/threonine protein kinase|nr:serine/threonine protein kinase [Scytonematopsis contorta HA4267-MV1]
MITYKNNNFSQLLQERYEIQKQLAKKAGRQTFLARDIQTQQFVIIKILRFGKDFAWENLKLFEREAETLKSLEHPAIPRYIDYFELDITGGKSYVLVQSYVAGGKTLEEWIQSGRKFTEKDVKKIAKNLLLILNYLHSRQPPVIHRDIKPSNIILTRKAVYLVDFGSVQTLASKAGKTITVVGTYGYMPPEQFGGYAKPASDLYSLGATLIALLTGVHPADLPQKDMLIDFEDSVKLSPKFTEWLQSLIEPSLSVRVKSATEALKSLETNLVRINETSVLSKNKTVKNWRLFWYAFCCGGGAGTGITVMSAVIYSTMTVPGMGTIVGGVIGTTVGLSVGLANAILLGIVTRLFYYPLKSPNLYRRHIAFFSTLTGTAMALIGYMPLVIDNSSISHQLFFGIVPSIITGLSMGVASKLFARWYERESTRGG